MPGKTNKAQAKPAQSESAQPTTETPVAPALVAEAKPAPTQKGGKKVAPITETTAVKKADVPVTKPKVAPAQKGGKKAEADAPKVATETVVEATGAPAQKQKGGKKAAAPKAVAVAVAVAVAKAAPKVAAKKVANEVEAKEDDDESGDRRVRSFKVKLPEKEDFEGRFTGLTPYQAANKALSKYFRETEKPAVEITFSICESTRKSKKSVYTYVGRRQKLDTPVTYKIQDGREIVKNFKNSLKKVKKSEAVESA
jgi:hypothetical protein